MHVDSLRALEPVSEDRTEMQEIMPFLRDVMSRSVKAWREAAKRIGRHAHKLRKHALYS